MDLDEISSAPLDEPQLLLRVNVDDLSSTVLELDDVARLDHLVHRYNPALDWEVFERHEMFLSFNTGSGSAYALASHLGAVNQFTSLLVLDISDTLSTRLLLGIGSVATGA